MCDLLARIYHIIKRDLLIDLRDNYRFLSSMLYLVAISFVVFKLFGSLEGPTRIGIFWIIMVFTAIMVINDSFSIHSSRRRLALYQLYDPIELLTAKLVSNFTKMLIAGILLMTMLSILSNQWLKDWVLFAQVFTLAILGIVIIMTMVSSMTMYSSNQNSLMSVLSLPLLIPVLLIAMRLSLISERMFFDTAVSSNLLMLLGIDLLSLVIAFGLISFTWKP